MPPILVHSDSPIKATAAKPDGTTPQTDAAPLHEAPPPTTTFASAPSPAYPAARPGQAAVPAPTGSVNSPYTPKARRQPAPTRTTALPEPETDGPPSPQPGAVPQPPITSNTSTLPPPPKAGESPRAARSAQAPPQPPATTTPAKLPPQFSIPPPQSNAAHYVPPTHSTDITAAAGSRPAPISVPQPQTTNMSLDHPPGYQQNPYADAMTSEQRAAQNGGGNATAAGEGNTGGLSGILASAGNLLGTGPVDVAGMFAGGNRSSGDARGGGLSTGEGSGPGFDGQGAWDTAMKWVGGVGGKLAEVEGEVWKKINSKE